MAVYQPVNATLWQGRVDAEETRPAWRWHQKIAPLNLTSQHSLNSASTAGNHLALLGFECDAGVKRNKGRVGAIDGPNALRAALANLASKDTAIYDAGNVRCDDENLEQAQTALAEKIDQLIKANLAPVVLGGGHEVAWASFQGLMPSLQEKKLRLGIINFDAHLDLRAPNPVGSSGTPFRQINEWCQAQQQPFHYCVLGVNPSANTQALFDYANDHHVRWVEDSTFENQSVEATLASCAQFLNNVDALYVTVCLDVFNAAFAPGVSAPAAFGVTPAKMLAVFRGLLALAKQQGKNCLLLDIAELNPQYDRDNLTAKLGARLIWEYQDFLQQI